jgi:hypothetical protein
MKTKNLEKWRGLDKILEDNLFEIKYTIDDWKHCYYSENFNGHLEYDIDSDAFTIFNNNGRVLEEISDKNLNEDNLLRLIQSI